MNNKYTRRNILIGGITLFTTSLFASKENKKDELKADKNTIKTRKASCNYG